MEHKQVPCVLRMSCSQFSLDHNKHQCLEWSKVDPVTLYLFFSLSLSLSLSLSIYLSIYHVPSQDFQRHIVLSPPPSFLCSVRGDWYWSICWPTLFKLSFYNPLLLSFTTIIQITPFSHQLLIVSLFSSWKHKKMYIAVIRISWH